MKLYDALLEKYGMMRQLDKAVEELSELITVLAKYKYGQDTKAHITEEMADVTIMLEEIKQYLHISDTELNNKIQEKKRRTARRLCAKCGYHNCDDTCDIDGAYSVGGCFNYKEVKI